MGPMTTSRTSATSRRNSRRAATATAGFSLVELLVTIGIIVLLISIAAPLALKAYRNGRQARLSADLQAVEAGLHAYKDVWGDYPRIPDYPGGAEFPAALTPPAAPGMPIPSTGA